MAACGHMAMVEVEESILVRFAHKLAANDKKVRDRALKKLRNWIKTRSDSHTKKGGFIEGDMLKIWKGLHYCMWMADKPLVQEELAQSLGSLIWTFGTLEQSLLFLNTFLQTEAREWFGIDRLRLDKFLMLVRQCFHQGLLLVKQTGWNPAAISKLVEILSSTVISGVDNDVPDGLKFHIADIFLEELTKVDAENLTSSTLHTLLAPFCVLLSQATNTALFQHVLKRVFIQLVDQEVDAAEAMMENEDSEAEPEEMDESPRLQVDYEALAQELFDLAKGKQCVGRNRKSLYSLVKTFKNLAQGILPEEQEIDSDPEDGLSHHDVDKAVVRLQKLESGLMANSKHSSQKRKKKTNTKDKVEPKTKKRK